jgi:hypothetical protein
MKKLGLVIIGFVFALNGFGQTLDWAKSFGGTSFDLGYSITVDASGNVYTTGVFDGTVDLDPGPGVDSHTSAWNDCFVQKLDAAGNLLWAKSFGGTNDDDGQSINVDASGNVYVTGSFRNIVDFDPGTGTFNLTSAGSSDIFVLKLDATGNFVWAKSFGGTGDDQGWSSSIDASGNVYTTGFFTGTADFDPGAGTFNLTSTGDDDAFVQKLDASGNFLWARSFGGTSADEARAISTVTNATTTTVTGNGISATGGNNPGNCTGAILPVGTFLDGTNSNRIRSTEPLVTLTLEHTVPAGTAITIALCQKNNTSSSVDITDGTNTQTFNAGPLDLSQYITFTTGQSTNTLTFSWNAGVVRLDGVEYSITTSSTTDVYTTGHFQGTVDFDPTGGTNNLTSTGGYDVFVQKLDGNGNFVWANSVGGTADDFGYANAVDASGNVHSTGVFRNTVNFDPGAGTLNLTSSGVTDVFVQKLDASGNLLWANSSGGLDIDQGKAITVDGSGNVYTTGNFRANVDFDPGVGTFPVASLGGFDGFVQKLDASGNFVYAISLGGTGSDSGNSLSVDASGNVHTTGNFNNTVDFDPGSGATNLTSLGSNDVFVQKLSECPSSYGTDIITACDSYTWIDGNTYNSSNNTATHILTNVAGCDSVVTLNLTINSVSDITTSLNGLTITATNSNATYQWLDCDDNNAAINGETNQTFTTSVSGNYAVELTENGCVDTSDCLAISSVGVIENNFGTDLLIYPNPTLGNFSIDLGTSYDKAQVIITDISGRVIQSKIVTQEQILYLLIDDPAGIYFVSIQAGDKTAVIRLVKQ